MTCQELCGIRPLKPEVVALVEFAERAGGRPVDFRIDDEMEFPARTLIARYRMPASIVTVNLGRDDRIDHAIARECAQIGRVLGAPAAERIVAATSAATLAVARAQLEPEDAFLPPAERDARIAAWIDAFVGRLTTLPARMRVEKWLHREYPGLREDQVRALDAEATDLLQDMSTTAGTLPPSIFRMSAMLTFAFVQTIGAYIGKRHLASAVFPRVTISMGQQLKRLADNQPSGVPGDTATADAWADALGVRNWYEWVPFEDAGGSPCGSGKTAAHDAEARRS